jgi:hypothetical protein
MALYFRDLPNVRSPSVVLAELVSTAKTKRPGLHRAFRFRLFSAISESLAVHPPAASSFSAQSEE